jgi:hypothetical protein
MASENCQALKERAIFAIRRRCHKSSCLTVVLDVTEFQWFGMQEHRAEQDTKRQQQQQQDLNASLLFQIILQNLQSLRSNLISIKEDKTMSSSTVFSFLEIDDNSYHEEYFQEIGDYDIIFGRGGKSYGHPGNRLFRRLVFHNKSLYESLKKPTHRQFIALSIVRSIQRSGGKFMRKHEKGKEGLWKTVSVKEACIKTSQALRDANIRTKKESRIAKRSHSVGSIGDVAPCRQQAVVSPTYSSSELQVNKAVVLPAVPSLNPAVEPSTVDDTLDDIDMETIHTLVRSLGENHGPSQTPPSSSSPYNQRSSFTRTPMPMKSTQRHAQHYLEERSPSSRLSFTVRDWISKQASNDTDFPPPMQQSSSFRCSITSVSMLDPSLFNGDFDLEDFEIDEALATGA